MAGRGRTPKANPRNPRDARLRGNPKAADGTGWQHGPRPRPPSGLRDASKRAWATWMSSWFAANWTPDDLPGLRTIVLLYDQVERGEYQRATELRLQMDTYGITPKGQQDRRWLPPKEDERAEQKATPSSYGHLKVVGE